MQGTRQQETGYSLNRGSLAVIVIVTVTLCLLPFVARALIGEMKKDPTDMVAQYVMLDERGARLDALSFETLKPYIDWKEEPAWGHAVVIAGYKVVGDVKQWEVLSEIDVLIPVEFKILGLVYWETASFIPESHTEVVKFHVKGIRDRWRIVDPILPPHVGHKRMVQLVRQALIDEKATARQAALSTLREDLQKAQR